MFIFFWIKLCPGATSFLYTIWPFILLITTNSMEFAFDELISNVGSSTTGFG
jgi:hypothetical protein